MIYTYIKKHPTTIILISILFFSFFSKIYNIGHPDVYVFDEVYVRFTAEQFAKFNYKAWVWDYPSPEGFAYGWSHPPLGKLIMAGSILLFGQGSWQARLVPAISGTLLSLIVFFVSKQLFPKNKSIWLFAAAFISLDGLIFVLSRTGLTDTTLTLFLTTSVYFLLRKKYSYSAIFWGLALSVKWTSLYLSPVIAIIAISYLFWEKKITTLIKNIGSLFQIGSHYLFIGPIVYLTAHIPFFLSGYSWDKFIQLQKQMYWYHTGLDATHAYQSPALSWPINYRPVWFWVEYGQDTISNIYALGNPVIFWIGFLSVFVTLGYAYVSKQKNLWYLLLFYITFWVPWIYSPRIMFLYHYSPALPYLCIILSFFLVTLSKQSKLLKYIPHFVLALAFVVFIFFYPYISGQPVPTDEVVKYQWLDSWK